jgi:hypothetical protein
MVRFGLFFIALTAAQATPVSCVTGTLSEYLMLPGEGCSLGNTVVSSFINPGVLPGSTEIDPAAITVTPLLDPSFPGLLFTYDRMATGGAVFQSVVEFLITFSGTAPGFASLRSTGASADPGGATVVTSEFCPGDITGCGAAAVVLGVFDVGVDALTLDSRALPAGALFAVRHDAVIDGAFGDASLGSAELTFTQIPEPGTALTFLGALAFFAIRCYRHQR